MRKILIAILLCLMVAGTAYGKTMMAVCAGVVSAKSCPADAGALISQSGLSAGWHSVADAAEQTYVGQGNYDPGGTDVTICSVDVSFRIAAGTGATVQVEIWEMSGTSLSGTAGAGDCVSDTLEVTTANDMTVHSLGGMSCTLDNTKLYGVVVTRSDHSFDNTNKVEIFTGDVGSWSGQWMEWKADKSRDTDRSEDLAFDLNGF